MKHKSERQIRKGRLSRIHLRIQEVKMEGKNPSDLTIDEWKQRRSIGKITLKKILKFFSKSES